MDYLLQTINELGTDLVNEKITKNNLLERINQLETENQELKTEIETLKSQSEGTDEA